MRPLLFLYFAIFMLVSCRNHASPEGNTPAQANQTSTSSGQPPADFEAFYEKFHQDSLFQMAHIIWPVQGRKTMTSADSSASQVVVHLWTPEEWVMHHPIDYSDGYYAREIQMLGDMIVIERVRNKTVNYGLERRFARQSDTGEWALIYYADMQEMGSGR